MFKCFRLYVSVSCFISLSKSTVLLQSSVLPDTVMLVCSLSVKIRKRLSRDVADTFAVHSNLVHGVTDSDCWPHNGSTYGHVSAA